MTVRCKLSWGASPPRDRRYTNADQSVSQSVIFYSGQSN